MTFVYITLIVCSTLVALKAINIVNKVLERKAIERRIARFKKAFPTPQLKVVENRKPQQQTNDDLPKFGDF